MNIIFDQQSNPEAAYKNPYIVVEKFNLQCHIFSYRSVDFPNLFGFLNQHLNQKSEGIDKTPRLNDQLNDLFNNNQRGKNNLV